MRDGRIYGSGSPSKSALGEKHGCQKLQHFVRPTCTILSVTRTKILLMLLKILSFSSVTMVPRCQRLSISTSEAKLMDGIRTPKQRL